MARRYRVTVEGKTYEVTVEEIEGQGIAQPGAAAATLTALPGVPPVAPVLPAAPVAEKPAPRPAVAARPAAAPQPAKPAQAPAAGNAGHVVAPMPGVISDILVKPGDKVKRGAVLLLLEAMKMQNEIMAPADGEVESVNVSKGASVNTGDLMVVLRVAS